MTRPRVAVLDHGMGNLRSVAKAIDAAGGETTVTSAVGELGRADGLCVPGQGIFGRCIDNLTREGLTDIVTAWASSPKPYLGICLGMQILFERSEERGPVPGLGVLQGEVRRIRGAARLPHMGWNEVGGRHYYFDHSYVAAPRDTAAVTGWCEHGERFAARVETDGVLGVQFHPEKSGREGLTLLREWVGSL